MKNNLIAACLQLTSSSDIYKNLKETIDLSNKAIDKGAFLISTPEVTNIISLDRQKLKRSVFLEKDDPFLIEFTKIAKKKSVWILLGSIVIKDNKNKLYNRSYLINSKGNIQCKYDKIHMFDVKISKKESYKESKIFKPGKKVVVTNTPWGKIGLSICYDLRFPELYRKQVMMGAKLITIPSAFTTTTGKAHWHNLVKTRAIENGSYVLAPAQYGKNSLKRHTYGHSLIVSPWGEILAEKKAGKGIIMASLDFKKLAKIRANIPSFRAQILK
jgi:predicted amidohydrolase